MAEKEERYISITQMVAKENIETEKYRVMNRQEAIEKMAKGIVSILAVQPGTEPDPWEMWKDYAEAALDALLEE